MQSYSEYLPCSKAWVTGVILGFCRPQGSEVWELCPLCGDGEALAVTAPFSVLYTYGLFPVLEVPHSSCIWPDLAGEKPVV